MNQSYNCIDLEYGKLCFFPTKRKVGNQQNLLENYLFTPIYIHSMRTIQSGRKNSYLYPKSDIGSRVVGDGDKSIYAK